MKIKTENVYSDQRAIMEQFLCCKDFHEQCVLIQSLYTQVATMMQSLSKSLANHKPHIEYLNVTETANILRVSKQSVYNMIKDGRIQAYKVGREWRFMPSDIYAVGQSSNTQHQIQMAAKGGEIDQADLKVILDELERDSQK